MIELPELPPAQRRHVEFHGYSFLAEPFPGCVTNEEAKAYGKACARAAMERAAQIADAERAEFMPQAANNNGSRESDFAFGSVNSAERIAAAIRAEIEKDPK